MRLAFISDIHGNATALEAVLEDIKKQHIDKIYVLGDLCYRGPEPQVSLDLVQSLDADVIKGNADEWVIRGVGDTEVPENVQEMMSKERDWTVANINKEGMDYLRNLTTEVNVEVDKVSIHAFHATPTSLFDVVPSDASDAILSEELMVSAADIFIYGHIHKAYVRFIGGKCIINTGSVGLPFDGLNKASYAIVDINGDQMEASIVRVSYDLGKVVEQFKESDYPNKELMISLLNHAGVIRNN